MIVIADIDWRILSVRRLVGKALMTGFFLLPVLDNLSGAGAVFFGQTVSFFLRMLLLVFFFHVAAKQRFAAMPKLLGLIAVLAVPIVIRYLASDNFNHLSKDTIMLLKILYGIFGIYAIYTLLSRGEIDDEQLADAVALSVAVYSVVIFLAFLFNTGLASYGRGGTTGFILAGNDVSHSIAISVPFVYWFAAKRIRNVLLKGVLLLVVAGALLLLFTKSGILGLLLLAWLAFLGSPRRAKVVVLAAAGGAVAFAIVSVLIGRGIIYDLFSIYRMLYEEFGLMGLFFRGRQDIFGVAPQLVREMHEIELLFGTGMSAFAERYAQVSQYWASRMKLAEMDPFDLFFSYGITGTAVVLWIYIRHSRASFLKTQCGIDLRYSLFIFWIHSIFAGHAISTPIVGTYIAAILGLGYYSRLKRNEEPPATPGGEQRDPLPAR